MLPSDTATINLARALRALPYKFTTVTPASHRRILQRPAPEAPTVRDIFGWNRPFYLESVAQPWRDLLEASGLLVPVDGEQWRCSVRFSSLGETVYMHSAFPTDDPRSVFFGPDTYRFARLLEQRVRGTPSCCVDIGCGSGAGALHLRKSAKTLVLADINAQALRYAAINAAVADCSTVALCESNILDNVTHDADLIVSNPPYVVDNEKRLYRHGGNALGTELAYRIVAASLQRLAARRAPGQLVLYTGTPVVNGIDIFFRSIQPLLDCGGTFDYGEIDPDVFGEELDRPCYATADRLAVVYLDYRFSR